MNFAYLEGIYEKWREVLVIGRTFERDGKRYHILGMTLAEEAKLYIIEPYDGSDIAEMVFLDRRSLYKMPHEYERGYRYLGCCSITLGNAKLEIDSGQGNYLQDLEGYAYMPLFYAMLNAGWTVPEWLKEINWENLSMSVLYVTNQEHLPVYTPNMPITIEHRMDSIRHIIEKPVTLTVGESCAVSFTDSAGEKVWCYINDVKLVDVWLEAEKGFAEPRFAEQYLPEELAEVKAQYRQALEQDCPPGTYYISIEYECSKAVNLQFYTVDFLAADPVNRGGSFHCWYKSPQFDGAVGAHGLPLKGDILQTPVLADTVTIQAELFAYMEMVAPWTESI